MKVFRMDSHWYGNRDHWGLIGDEEGEMIEGGIREAVRRGLVTEEILRVYWNLEMEDNGDVYDLPGSYGEYDVVYRRLVDGMAVTV